MLCMLLKKEGKEQILFRKTRMERHDMFDRTAAYYDLIYRWKDYAAEAESIRSCLQERAPEAKTLLDVACGTGEHLKHLKAHYRVEGLDLNEDFVRIARKKLPSTTIHHGDMGEFHLGRTFDAVLCLFSSIGYLRTLDRVAESLRCFRDHLSDDGVLLVEPWFTPETWHPGRVHMIVQDEDDLKVCRMNRSETREGLSFLHFHYLVGTADEVVHLEEEHELGLFSIEEMKEAFRDADLTVDHDPEGPSGRGLYVARKG